MNDKKMNRGVLRLLLFAVGGFAVVAIFFFGTLFFLDYWDTKDPASRDRLRAEHAKSIMSALEKFHGARGAYPVFPAPYDVAVASLRKNLVEGGYIRSIPADPLWPDKPYHYVSVDGKTYGLLFRLELAQGNIPADGQCLIGVGTAATGWWGQPPNCPF
ncbi:hypothetical protein [Bradyrhizobium sp.]